MESQLRHATQGRDILKMKLCLFAICTSLVVQNHSILLYRKFYYCILKTRILLMPSSNCLFVHQHVQARDSDSAFHPAIHRIRKILEMVLLWPSFDADEGIIMLALRVLFID